MITWPGVIYCTFSSRCFSYVLQQRAVYRQPCFNDYFCMCPAVFFVERVVPLKYCCILWWDITRIICVHVCIFFSKKEREKKKKHDAICFLIDPLVGCAYCHLYTLSCNIVSFLTITVTKPCLFTVFVFQLFKFLPRLSPRVANILKEMQRH